MKDILLAALLICLLGFVIVVVKTVQAAPKLGLYAGPSMKYDGATVVRIDDTERHNECYLVISHNVPVAIACTTKYK